MISILILFPLKGLEDNEKLKQMIIVGILTNENLLSRKIKR